jgi:hypothetical protein
VDALEEGAKVATDLAVATPHRPSSDAPALAPTRDTARKRRGRLRLWEIYFLGILATYIYALLGWWLKYHYHFSIGDALARTTDAKAIIFSRDPHAAAIGVYWMPLPTIVQLPFVAILEPLRHVEFAGPLSTAFFGGGTVVILGKLCRDLGLSRPTGFLLSAAYAFNPVVAYFAANGMSEGAEFFFIALSLWGLLRFLRDDRNSSAVITAFGLAGLALTKYEVAPMILLIAVVLTLMHLRKLPRGQWHESALNLSIIVLPSIFFVAVWLTYQKLILGSFLAFTHVSTGSGVIARPEVKSVFGDWSATAEFVGHWLFVFFPACVLLIPVLVLPPWRRMLGGLAVAATGVVAVIATAYYLYEGHSVGEPRYFTSIIIIGTIAVIVVAARIPRGNISHWVIDPAAILIVLVAAYSGTYAEAANRTSVEGEERVFQVANGVYDPHPPTSLNHHELSQQAARKLDSLLQPGDRAFVDERYDQDVFLFSYKPDQIVTNSDRDYEQLASPTGISARIGWAVVPHAVAAGQQLTDDDAYQLVRRQTGWTKMWQNDRVEIWLRDPDALRGLPMPPRG